MFGTKHHEVLEIRPWRLVPPFIVLFIIHYQIYYCCTNTYIYEINPVLTSKASSCQ